jgi:putative aldouronate transport system permease protein
MRMAAVRHRKEPFHRYFLKNWQLYLLSVPGLTYLVVYKFMPLYGLTIAFKDFSLFTGDSILESIALSPWVGLKHFGRIFDNPDITRVIWNTLVISVYKVVYIFPLPILLALLLNEVRARVFKGFVQTFTFMPHFLSWVVVFGLFSTLLGSYGAVNQILRALGFETVQFFTDSSLFRPLLVFTEAWKETGWSAIIFLAAITSINPQLYEAAVMDGANRWHRMRYITLPGILPVIVLVLILRISDVLHTGFEQVLAMYNPAVYSVADIIQTYVYRIGLGRMDFSLGTALGLFEAVVAFILIVSGNLMARKVFGKSIW